MRRPPFFRIGAKWFIDLGWNFDDAPITPSAEQWEQLIAGTPAGRFVIGRELNSAEAARLVENRDSSDEDTFSKVITKDEARWLAPTGRWLR